MRPSTDFGDCVMVATTIGQPAAKASKASDRILGGETIELVEVDFPWKFLLYDGYRMPAI